jgi:iron complex outermembrane receptor protein
VPNYLEKDLKNITSQDFLSFTPLQTFERNSTTQEVNKMFYFKPSVVIKLNQKSNLVLRYNFSKFEVKENTNSFFYNKNTTSNLSLANYSNAEISKPNHELVARYKITLDSLNRNIEITTYYSFFNKINRNTSTQYNNTANSYNNIALNLDLHNAYSKIDFSYPLKELGLAINSGFKYGSVNALSNGKYNLNNPQNILNSSVYHDFIDYDYSESNVALYAEMKKSISKFTFGAGLRWENYNLKSTIKQNNTVIANTYKNFFPNLNLLYKINSAINFTANYNKKIALPSYGDLDPNNSGYLDPNNSGYLDQYNSTYGNPFLQPSYFNNYEFKITAFSYLYLSAQISRIKNANIVVYETPNNSLLTNKANKTFNRVNNFSMNIGIPIPFAVFTKGLSFFQTKNINIDQLNYMYLFASYNNYKVQDYPTINKNNPIFTIGSISQIILPKEIKLSLQYNFYSKGTYQIYQITKQIQSFDLSLSKFFLEKSLKTTLSVTDLFNSNEINAAGNFSNMNLNYYQKNDSRVFWLKLSYNFGKVKNSKKENSEIDIDTKKTETNQNITPQI